MSSRLILFASISCDNRELAVNKNFFPTSRRSAESLIYRNIWTKLTGTAISSGLANVDRRRFSPPLLLPSPVCHQERRAAHKPPRLLFQQHEVPRD